MDARRPGARSPSRACRPGSAGWATASGTRPGWPSTTWSPPARSARRSSSVVTISTAARWPAPTGRPSRCSTAPTRSPTGRCSTRMINTASGASWVSIHHGGGVGIGRSIHAGQVSAGRRHRAGRGEAGPGADQRPGDGRHPARRRRLRPGRRGGRRAAAYGSRCVRREQAGDRAPQPEVLSDAGSRSFDGLWSAIDEIGRVGTGGYRRFAWTDADLTLREWFAGEARGPRAGPGRGPGRQPVGLVGRPRPRARASSPARTWTACPTAARTTDRSAWSAPSRPSTRCAGSGFRPERPIGVVNFGDEEGARFGVACAGSRLITGVLPADAGPRAPRRRRVARWPRRCGPRPRPERLGADPEALAPGRHLRRTARRAGPRAWSTATGRSGWPPTSGRTAAGGSTCPARPTTPARPRCADRRDAMLGCAQVVLAARARGRAARRARHRRQARRRAGRGQRHPRPVTGLAGRAGEPTRRRSAAAVAELGGWSPDWAER